MTKKKTAKKEYVCDACGEPIFLGEEYLHHSGYEPRYDGDNYQVGIAFYLARTHIYNCTAPPECQAGNHKLLVYAPTGQHICSECGYEKEK